jgi:hypothetical protein
VIAALFVERGGVYCGLPDVDPWSEDRDARLYAGPWPVVAHPPCARWGRYWYGSPSSPRRFKKGDDGGCFAAALAAVRRWGGVLEHPEGSAAWPTFGIPAPPRSGGWVALLDGGWTCCVEQGHYGHPARKPTWLLAYGFTPPTLAWGVSAARGKCDLGLHRGEDRRKVIRRGEVEQFCKRKRAATPPAFRDLLLAMARTALPQEVAR